MDQVLNWVNSRAKEGLFRRRFAIQGGKLFETRLGVWCIAKGERFIDDYRIDHFIMVADANDFYYKPQWNADGEIKVGRNTHFTRSM